MDRAQMTPDELARDRESRRHPRLAQFDYLHLVRLRDDLAEILAGLPIPVTDALDIFCGARPYEDLMPPGARVVGYDIDDHYGVADVVGGEFLPFDDASFDLAICIEGFFYIEDQAHGAAEIRRVLRPGGIAVITVPQIWQYERDVFEHRYTEPSLRAVFSDWDDVRVVENGGIVVSWALLSGILLQTAASASPRPLRPLVRLVVTPLTALVNLVGGFLDRIERRRLADASGRMPANLALVARAPAD